MPRASHAAEDGATGKAQRSVQSAEVGGRLLLALADALSPLNLKDLAARAGLPPARAHPYLVSFGRLGLVEQDAASQRYTLGPSALQMGLACLHQLDPLRTATPIAEALAAEIGQMVVIAVWANFGPTVVRMVEGGPPIHVNMRAGTVMSVLGTATGRAFAAALPAARLKDVLAGPAGARRASNGTKRADLAAEIARSGDEWRTHGVTRAVGRPIPGVNAFSAPVFDHEGEAALVITALGHEDSFPAHWKSPAALAVKRAAAVVSAKLGHRAAAASSASASLAPGSSPPASLAPGSSPPASLPSGRGTRPNGA